MHKGDVIDVKYYSRLMHWYRWQEFSLPFFNGVARTAMGIKNSLDQWNTRKKIRISEKNLDRFLGAQKIFFGFSTARSGSTFLTDLLAGELEDGLIVHEPNINDYWSYPQVLRAEKNAETYVRNYRKKEIFERIAPREYSIYGEFNPFFVLHCRAVSAMIPGAIIFHLVRDGRDVVRSIYSREILGHKDPMSKLIKPPEDDPYYEEWSSFNRFEKICWKWQYENTLLRDTIEHKVHFEQLIKNYDYFNTHINKRLGVNIPEQGWALRTTSPKHASPVYKLEHWTKWPAKYQKSFERICGAEMDKCGYNMD